MRKPRHSPIARAFDLETRIRAEDEARANASLAIAIAVLCAGMLAWAALASDMLHLEWW